MENYFLSACASTPAYLNIISEFWNKYDRTAMKNFDNGYYNIDFLSIFNLKLFTKEIFKIVWEVKIPAMKTAIENT